MYKIINDDWNQALPNIFATFTEAFKYYNTHTDKQANIYYITEEENTKVWDPRWSFFCPELAKTIDN